MRCFLFLLLGFLFFQTVRAQPNQQQLEQQMEKLIKDSSYGTNAAKGKFYHIRGIDMYAETYGSGAPLLIIHGNGGSIDNFAFQIPYFSKKYKVIVADSRAQGRSKDPSDSLSYEMMADDYAAL